MRKKYVGNLFSKLILTCAILISNSIFYRKKTKITVNIQIIYCVTNAKRCDVNKPWHLAMKPIVTQ